jgi:hypothetical protein
MALSGAAAWAARPCKGHRGSIQRACDHAAARPARTSRDRSGQKPSVAGLLRAYEPAKSPSSCVSNRDHNLRFCPYGEIRFVAIETRGIRFSGVFAGGKNWCLARVFYPCATVFGAYECWLSGARRH